MTFLKRLRQLLLLPQAIYDKLDQLQQAIGRLELAHQQMQASNDIRHNEFKVYSQNGEDGIIQFLLRHIRVERDIFVEFGVADYQESNTRFLLQQCNWSGLIMDGSAENIERIKSSPLYWRYNVKAEQTFITAENINELLRRHGIAGDIGILSIDIDGNDYWVWKAMEDVRPAIVITEYNSLFGAQQKVTIPYDKDFVREQAHYSTLYYGASIAALEHLARSRNYALVGSNQAGNNLFFVRDDLLGTLRRYTPEKAYVQAQFRESRAKSGQLTFLGWEERLAEIAEMPLFEIESQRVFKVKELCKPS
ncbi:MAG: hypothetical protein H0T73_21380 [Ardenticatenales bacterium]|nr:hypothetical protein [Ardenticatenales bacterium]